MGRSAAALEKRLAGHRPVARSLVVSVFGDVVEPHGGAVWLGTVVGWLAGFGIADRNVRTAVTRLVNEDWLARRSVGRRSELVLGGVGRSRTREAEQRIYAAKPREWKETWSLVMLGHCGLSRAAHDAVARDLGLLGFGEVASGTFAHPAAEVAEVLEVLEEHGVDERAVALAAGPHPGAPDAGALGPRAMVSQGWDLDELGRQYEIFAERFEGIDSLIQQDPDPEAAFGLRVLAVHEYRRIVLRDPQLPGELLPGRWPGTRARGTLASLYEVAAGPSTEWIRHTGAAAAGRFPSSAAALRRRFRQSG